MPEAQSSAGEPRRASVAAEPPSVSRSEHLLSWVLGGFVLLALSWGYVNIDEAVRDRRAPDRAVLVQPIQQAEEASVERRRELGLTGRLNGSALYVLEQRLAGREASRVTARERYRTALDAGDPAAALKAAYLTRDARAVVAAKDLRRLKRDRRIAYRELGRFDAAQAGRLGELRARVEAHDRTTDRWIFLWRVLLAFGTLGLSFLALRWATERAPRFVPLVQAVVGASAVLALALIIDYTEVNLDFYSVGPLGLAVLGAALTIAAFFALQRYLRQQRPGRRVRAGECGGCGYPVRGLAGVGAVAGGSGAGAGGVAFCEGCGRPVVEPCGACGAPRRSGTEHCGACGAG